MHTNIQTYKHTNIQTYIHSFMHSFIHSFIDSYIHTFIHSCILTYIHTYIFTYMYIYKFICIYRCTCTYIYILWHTYTYIYNCTYVPCCARHSFDASPALAKHPRDPARYLPGDVQFAGLLGCQICQGWRVAHLENSDSDWAWHLILGTITKKKGIFC